MATIEDTTRHESTIDTTLGWLAVVLALSLPLYRPWVTLATSAFLLIWLFGKGLGARVRRLRENGLTLAVLVFVGLSITSLLWTNHLPEGLRYLTKYRYFLLIPMVASSVGPLRTISRVSIARSTSSRTPGRGSVSGSYPTTRTLSSTG